MKRVVLLAGLCITLVIGVLGIAYWQTSNEATKQNNEQTAAIQPPAKNERKTTPPASRTPGAYVEYSDSALQNAKGTRVLFFHAPWCPQCRAIDADIAKTTVPDGITIIKTDYDSQQALRQKYGITLQTTFVAIDAKDNAIKKYVAYNEPTFDAVKRNLLDTL